MSTCVSLEVAPAGPEGLGSSGDSFEGLGGGSCTASDWPPTYEHHRWPGLVAGQLRGMKGARHRYTCSPEGIVDRGPISAPTRNLR